MAIRVNKENMMNLLQLTAQEVQKWPDGAEWLAQTEQSGLIIFDADHGGFTSNWNFIASEIADDASDALITRAQWEAERVRIAAMEGSSAVSQEQANAEAERENRTQYEQELWDKVALDAQAMIFDAAGQEEPLVDIARRVGLWADAFMAERAKRLKR